MKSAIWPTAYSKKASAGSALPTSWPKSSHLIMPNRCVQAISRRVMMASGTPGAIAPAARPR